jgi:hypothetical protein
VQQGHPLVPLLFCLVMRHVSLGVANIFSSTTTPGKALNTSYLDDGLFGHNQGTLTCVLEYLQSPAVQSLGLYLNIEKSSIYQPNQLPIPHMLPADFPFERGPSSGLKLLGARISNLEFCSGVLERTVAKVSQAHDLLNEMNDLQVELHLLRARLGSGKMIYLNRVIPTHNVLPHATPFDVSMRACLARITQRKISAATWSQEGLPLAMGGLGLTHNAHICSAAFISSSNMTT